jgi:hypothetical protein
MRFVKLTLPLIIVLVFGVFGAAIQYMAHPFASDTKAFIAQWLKVVGGIAFVLSIYNLTRLHVLKVRKQEAGWGYSMFFFLGFFAMAGATIYNGGAWFWSSPVEGAAFEKLYTYAFEAAGATMFCLLGFYIASAAVRTFRARSFEATLLLAAAMIVMLGRAPLGELITPYFPTVSEWIMVIPNTAAKRGVLLGVCFGGIAMSLRIIFGVERSYLGGSS